MEWSLRSMTVATFCAQVGVVIRIAISTGCTDNTGYLCTPFTGMPADMLGCFIMGTLCVKRQTSIRNWKEKHDAADDGDLLTIFPVDDRRVKNARFLLRSALCSVITSFSAWIVKSAEHWYEGRWVDGLSSLLVPSLAFITLLVVGKDVALLISRLRLERRKACWLPLLSAFGFGFGVLAFWAVGASGFFMIMAGSNVHWVVAILLVPIGTFTRIMLQSRLNTRRWPFGTMLCNILACTAESIVKVHVSGFSTDDARRSTYNGVLEGLIASTSTVASVIDEIVHECDTIHASCVSGFLYLVSSFVCCGGASLIVFAAGQYHANT